MSAADHDWRRSGADWDTSGGACDPTPAEFPPLNRRTLLVAVVLVAITVAVSAIFPWGFAQ